MATEEHINERGSADTVELCSYADVLSDCFLNRPFIASLAVLQFHSKGCAGPLSMN